MRWVRARASGHAVPAIAVTLFLERFGVREARAAGFDVFLRKPIDPTDIVHRADEIRYRSSMDFAREARHPQARSAR